MQNSQHTWWVWRKAGVQCGSCCFRSRPDSRDNLPSPGWTADPDTLGTHNPPSCKSRKKYSYYLPENIFTNIYIYKYIVAIYMYIYNCLERERERERASKKNLNLWKNYPHVKHWDFFFQMSFHTHTHTHLRAIVHLDRANLLEIPVQNVLALQRELTALALEVFLFPHCDPPLPLLLHLLSLIHDGRLSALSNYWQH